MLTAILGIVLLGTLYPLLAEALGAQVSVGPPYFNPATAVFVLPMLVVMGVGPLLRWRRDLFVRVRPALILPLLVMAGVALWLALSGLHLLPLLGIAMGTALLMIALVPLRGRRLRTVTLPLWGMVTAHFGIGVALLGIACDSAFSTERLVAARIGETVAVGPWLVRLGRVEPVTGPNWTALEATLAASYAGAAPSQLTPQARSFWTPPQQTSESAILTRWNGQLYTVLGEEAEDGRWQLRLWWKPFVTLIWFGGVLVALGGVLALLGRVASDWRRHIATAKIAYRRQRQGRG